jgi:hypothetical protein
LAFQLEGQHAHANLGHDSLALPLKDGRWWLQELVTEQRTDSSGILSSVKIDRPSRMRDREGHPNYNQESTMNLADLSTLYNYNYWANQRVLAAGAADSLWKR